MSLRVKHNPDEIWKFVDKKGEDECWIWKGFCNNYGARPRFIYNKRQWAAQVFVAHHFVHDVVIPAKSVKERKHYKRKEYFVSSICRNRFCMNPKHIFLSDVYIDDYFTPITEFEKALLKGKKIEPRIYIESKWKK